jgi:hypothetical protein
MRRLQASVDTRNKGAAELSLKKVQVNPLEQGRSRRPDTGSTHQDWAKPRLDGQEEKIKKSYGDLFEAVGKERDLIVRPTQASAVVKMGENGMKQPSQTLDRLTNTFTADREFFDAMMAEPPGKAFIEMCIWYLWLHEYLHDIQNSLNDAGKPNGSTYQLWVVSMIGGAAQAVGMLMYLMARGVVHEAAASGRRALESLGMACHLVRDPSKTQFLSGSESESRDFTKAFIRGPNQGEAKKLKEEGIRYRFAGMSKPMARAATQLYEIFSRFNVHGGTLSSLAGIALKPTANSCSFHNRSLDEVGKNVPLFKPILEITAIELMDLVGHFGVRSKRVNEAGACVLVWLDKTDPRWLERIRLMREDFGLAN